MESSSLFLQSRINKPIGNNLDSDPIEAKRERRIKAKKMGELGGQLFTGRLGRLPVSNKVLKQILKQTVGKGQDLMETGIEKLLEDYFVGVELKKRQKKQKNEEKN